MRPPPKQACLLQVGVLADDDGGVAAQLQRDGLDVLRRPRHDALANLCRPRERKLPTASRSSCLSASIFFCARCCCLMLLSAAMLSTSCQPYLVHRGVGGDGVPADGALAGEDVDDAGGHARLQQQLTQQQRSERCVLGDLRGRAGAMGVMR